MAIDRAHSIFVNCPFDEAYKPLFDAIVFTTIYCGFQVRSALEVSDAGEARLAKIVRLIGESRFSIHDISRIELDSDSDLPRFNMPIELGIAIGMKSMGHAPAHDHLLLVLDSERYRYQRYASDLAGVDIGAHGSTVAGVIAAVRDFLLPHVASALPGGGAILSALTGFELALPRLAGAARQTIDELTFIDRLIHLTTYLEGMR